MRYPLRWFTASLLSLYRSVLRQAGKPTHPRSRRRHLGRRQQRRFPRNLRNGHQNGLHYGFRHVGLGLLDPERCPAGQHHRRPENRHPVGAGAQHRLPDHELRRHHRRGRGDGAARPLRHRCLVAVGAVGFRQNSGSSYAKVGSTITTSSTSLSTAFVHGESGRHRAPADPQDLGRQQPHQLRQHHGGAVRHHLRRRRHHYPAPDYGQQEVPLRRLARRVGRQRRLGTGREQRRSLTLPFAGGFGHHGQYARNLLDGCCFGLGRGPGEAGPLGGAAAGRHGYQLRQQQQPPGPEQLQRVRGG